jgi:anaerobic ribonucleoside-triphosphate reductase
MAGDHSGSRFGGNKPLARVQKRDGRVVPFQASKIQSAIAAALAAEGQPDPAFAGEVASVVELTLTDQLRRQRKGASSVPTIEDIQDLVEQALMELGHPTVAKSYILYRDRRARNRKALRVHRSDSLRSPVRVREREGISQWSKGRLIGALITEAEMPREAAEEIAGGVERRVFASGLTHITTGLIRELVAGELLERGWVQAHHSLGALGLSRHDIAKVLAARPLDAWDEPAGAAQRVRPSVAGALLRKFALEDIVPDGVGELHRSGDLHIEDLRAPHLPLFMCLDTELLASGGNSVRSAQAVLEGVAELSGHVSQGIVLERPADVLAPMLRAARPQSPLGLGGWLRALGGAHRPGLSGCALHQVHTASDRSPGGYAPG